MGCFGWLKCEKMGYSWRHQQAKQPSINLITLQSSCSTNQTAAQMKATQWNNWWMNEEWNSWNQLVELKGIEQEGREGWNGKEKLSFLWNGIPPLQEGPLAHNPTIHQLKEEPQPLKLKEKGRLFCWLIDCRLHWFHQITAWWVIGFHSSQFKQNKLFLFLFECDLLNQ